MLQMPNEGKANSAHVQRKEGIQIAHRTLTKVCIWTNPEDFSFWAQISSALNLAFKGFQLTLSRPGCLVRSSLHTQNLTFTMSWINEKRTSFLHVCHTSHQLAVPTRVIFRKRWMEMHEGHLYKQGHYRVSAEVISSDEIYLLDTFVYLQLRFFMCMPLLRKVY